MMSREIEEKIREFEREGKYNEHINPIDWEGAKPVNESFPYIPKGLLKIKYALINFFVVRAYRWYHAKINHKVKIIGKENLKNIKSAIVISNHINMTDCMANSYALKGKKLKIVAAEFNNRKGKFGECMRAHGMLPLGSDFKTIKKFNNAVEHYLLHDNYVLIYPEEAMWEMYEKPRPFRKGAFYYASKYDVPIIPIFITLRDSGKKDSNGYEKKYFTVNICKAIYPDKNLTINENTEFLKAGAHKSCVEVYEKTYKKEFSL